MVSIRFISYSFLTKSAKLKLDNFEAVDPSSYSFLTKSAKLKLHHSNIRKDIGYSFLTKSAKLKPQVKWSDEEPML